MGIVGAPDVGQPLPKTGVPEFSVLNHYMSAFGDRRSLRCDGVCASMLISSPSSSPIGDQNVTSGEILICLGIVFGLSHGASFGATTYVFAC